MALGRTTAGIPGLRTRLHKALWAVALGLVAGILGALAWTAGDGLAPLERARLMRYVQILMAAGFGIATPHVLYPDPHARLLQLANAPAPALWARSLRRWLPVVAVLAVPVAVLAAGAGAARGVLAAEGLLATLGVGLYAWARVASLGERMRAWETGESGGAYRALGRWAPPLQFQVPDSLVPGLLVTGETFLVGAAVAIAGQASGLSGWGVGAAAGLVVLSAALVVRQRPGFDRLFYDTGGVWADAFGASAGGTDSREPIGYPAVYWAPRRLRPAVWAGLVSLDRRLPLGRAVAAGLALVLSVELAGASAGLRSASLALVVLGANAPVAWTASDALLPLPMARRTHRAAAWVLIRFLLAVRWLPPIVAVVLGLAWLSDRVAWTDAVVWSGVYVAVAAAFSVGATAVAELRARRVYA